MTPRKGQVTIFIIAAVVIVAGLALFLLFRAKIIPNLPGNGGENPKSILEACLEDKVKEGSLILMQRGGSIKNNLSIEFKFEDESLMRNVSYLCYSQNYYLPCIVQEPILIEHLKKEMEDYIFEDVKNCFDNMAISLEKKGYDVNARYRGFDASLENKKIIVNILADLTLTKAGSTTTEKDFKIIIASEIYNLAIIAHEIISQEAKFCNFEHLGFMLLYSDFEIDKFRTGNLDTIYRIKQKSSKEIFSFAVRSCAIPPAF
jgi:hypothetical protein